MSNIVKGNFDQFKHSNPEHATLLQLSEKHAIRTIHLENAISGAEMLLAYFVDGKWMHFYQRGSGHLSDHLWFWYWATQLPVVNPINTAVEMIGGDWQKST